MVVDSVWAISRVYRRSIGCEKFDEIIKLRNKNTLQENKLIVVNDCDKWITSGFQVIDRYT